MTLENIHFKCVYCFKSLLPFQQVSWGSCWAPQIHQPPVYSECYELPLCLSALTIHGWQEPILEKVLDPSMEGLGLEQKEGIQQAPLSPQISLS